MVADARTIAAGALTLILAKGKSTDRVLAKALGPIEDARDRGFAQELVYGVLRWYWQLKPQLETLLRRRMRERDREIEMLLLVGLYQLRHLTTPAHAAVDATVNACAGLKRPWAKGLINATLRNAIRQAPKLDAIATTTDSIESAHPDWLLTKIKHDWPEQWEAITRANNEYPPFTLRVNTRCIGRSEYLELLHECAIEAREGLHAKSAIRIERALPVESVPMFDNGYVSVQDEAAQLAARVLDLPEAGRVLDACAAPGGKTAHIIESGAAALDVIAVEQVEERAYRLQESMARLGFAPRVHVADAAELDAWWDGVPFDRILLDAPCSGTGVIRRHPDIKVLRRAQDIDALVTLQRRLLNALWRVLRPGGKLVYATCSILAAENEGVISGFLSDHGDVEVDNIYATWGIATANGRQILTGASDMDGFYYARLRKT